MPTGVKKPPESVLVAEDGPAASPIEGKTRFVHLDRAALVVGCAFLAWRLAALLLLAFAAILLALLLRAAARPLAKLLHVPTTMAVAAVIGMVSAAIWGGVTQFGRQAVGQLDYLSARIPAAWQSLSSQAEAHGLALPSPAWIGSHITNGTGLGVLAQLAGGVLGMVAGVLLVLVGGIYIAVQPDLYRRGLVALVPPARVAVAQKVIEESGKALRHWLIGQLATMAMVGTLTGVGAFMIGLPSAAALGLVAAMLEFIPYVGPVATAVPALLLAFPLGGEALLLTLLLLFAVQTAEGYLLTPLIQREAVSLPPALTLFAVFAMGILFGSLGVLLATPITVCIVIAIRHIYIPSVRRRIPTAGRGRA